jgi:hypothetical protein
MHLRETEEEWLNAYRAALRAQYPGTVEQMLI